MGRARCTLEVRGLDCAVEVAALRSALDGAPGVGTLGFDLIHGMMTVDYDPDATEPAALVRRIAARSGLHATLAGEPEVSGGWWSRNGRWASTAASGLALLAGVLVDWLGGPRVASGVAYGLAVLAGGARPGPSGLAEPPPVPARHPCPDGLGGARGDRARAVGRGGDGRLPVRAVRVARIPERRPRPASRPGLARGHAGFGRADRGGRLDRDGPRRRDCQGGAGPGPLGRSGAGGRAGRARAGRASTRRRSPASRCRSSARSATASSPARSTARGRWRSRPRGPWTTP